MHLANESLSKFSERYELSYPSPKDHYCLTMSVNERVNLMFGFLFELINGDPHSLCLGRLKIGIHFYTVLIN